MIFVLCLLAASQLFLISAAPLAHKRSINGPAISSNFPDPSFIQVDNQYFAFSTSGGGKNIPVATSPDFQTWSLQGDALPSVGAWSNGDNVWAPDVVQLGDGSFVLYYTATSASDTSIHCIGAATSSHADGPYTPRPESIACAASQGGAIDPAGFLDTDGSRYVVYKVDGNNFGHGGNCNNGIDPIVPTPIMLQQVSPSDGFTLIGDPQQILDRGDADGPLVEAPSLTRVADANSAGGWLYILFFSSNCYSGDLYDVSYATSSNGIRNGGADYEKSSAPLLVTGSDGGQLYSSGGLDVGPDASKVVFHADLGQSADTRQMWVGQITVDAEKRTVSI